MLEPRRSIQLLADAARFLLSAGRRLGMRRIIPVVLILVLSGSVLAIAQRPVLPSGSAVPEDAGSSGKLAARSQTVGRGTTYEVKATSSPPVLSDAQRRQLKAAEARSHRSGPPIGKQRPSAQVPSEPAPTPAKPTSQSENATLAADTLTTFHDRLIPGSDVSGGSASVSNIQEPSTDNNGKNIFQTGNWYATRSFDDGQKWWYLNPFTAFGAGFCCDQVALYDTARNLQFWLLQYDTHLTLVASKGRNLTTWCGWNIDASWFGEPTTTVIDYNDLASSNDFIYLASNLFPAAGGKKSGLVRMPMDAFDPGGTGCAGFTYQSFTDPSYFTIKPVQGATDTMYFGSNWGGTPGTSFRIYGWPETFTSPLIYDRTVTAYTFYERDSGQNCGSASGTVKNWCQFADSRVLGGYVTKDATGTGVVGFTFNAKQDANHPFPYTRRVWFRETDKASLGSFDHFSPTYAIQFMQIAPNKRGHLGAVFAWGGGTGQTNYYPGTASMVMDDYGTAYSFWLWGGSNACLNTDPAQPYYRWGDYLTVRPYHPSDLVWIGTGFRNVNGGPCSGGFSEPHNIIFGRGRDASAYSRWTL